MYEYDADGYADPYALDMLDGAEGVLNPNATPVPPQGSYHGAWHAIQPNAISAPANPFLTQVQALGKSAAAMNQRANGLNRYSFGLPLSAPMYTPSQVVLDNLIGKTVAEAQAAAGNPARLSGIKPLNIDYDAFKLNVPTYNPPPRQAQRRVQPAQARPAPARQTPNPEYVASLKRAMAAGQAPQAAPASQWQPAVTVTQLPNGQTQLNLIQNKHIVNDPAYQQLYALQRAKAERVLQQLGMTYDEALDYARQGKTIL